MHKQVFCIDTDDLEHLLSDQKPVEGMLYDVLYETNNGYFLNGFDKTIFLVNSEKFLFFKKSRFVEFFGNYETDKFNERIDDYTHWSTFFGSSISENIFDQIDLDKPDNLFLD